MSRDPIDFALMVIRKIFQSYHERESPRSMVSFSLNRVPEDGKQNFREKYGQRSESETKISFSTV